MTEQFIPHPPSPQPEKKDTVTFNKKNVAIAFLAVAIAILAIILIVPGDNKSTPNSNNTPAPVVTNPPANFTPAPVTNKYDDYMNHVLNNSGLANTWSKAQLIEFGDLVCQALDNGSTVRQVVNLLSSYAKTTSDMELFASVAYASITYLCPEYDGALQAYLNS